jgi:hypothetical protein
MRAFIVATVLVGLCISSSSAGGVGPSKPSDLRTVTGVYTGDPPCPGDDNLRSVTRQQNPDGTVTTFAIPEHKVFIVTDVEISAPGAPGGFARLALFILDGNGGRAVVARCGGIAGTDGFTNASCVIPNGGAVKAGSALCFGSTGAGGDIVVHGFLTKDK